MKKSLNLMWGWWLGVDGGCLTEFVKDMIWEMCFDVRDSMYVRVWMYVDDRNENFHKLMKRIEWKELNEYLKIFTNDEKQNNEKGFK